MASKSLPGESIASLINVGTQKMLQMWKYKIWNYKAMTPEGNTGEIQMMFLDMIPTA